MSETTLGSENRLSVSNFSYDLSLNIDEISLSLSPSEKANKIPNELLDGAAKSLDDPCTHPKHGNREMKNIPKIYSSLQWHHKLQQLRNHTNDSSVVAQIHLQFNEIFVNRLNDLENMKSQDLEAMLQLYKDWVGVLRSFNSIIFEDLEQLENAISNFYQIIQSLAYLESSQRDLVVLIKLLAEAYERKEWNWSGMIFETLKSADIMGIDDTNIVSSSTPYAELWMGNHPSGTSTVKNSGENLSAALGSSLPFLFKVLSIRKALSIQVHPNKAEAKRLHKERPDIYADPNHKPELAIALTPFQALCGFRPYSEIYKFCEELPPLKELLGGDEIIKKLKGNSTLGLKIAFEKLMTSQEADIKHCICCIRTSFSQVLASNSLLDIFCTINADFPNDVGVLSLFFLNIIRLTPGQAIYLGANEIHAYISGDCVECMACSDNVIRAGLTPKYKDVAQLISCLNYAGLSPNEKLFQPERIDEFTRIFIPPIKDFAVAEVILPSSTKTYDLKIHKDDSILLVLEGERNLNLQGSPTISLKRGSVIYIPSNVCPVLNTVTENPTEGKFIAYIAMCNHF